MGLLTMIKEELRDFREQAIDHMSQPVNNFLKDLSQIEMEFRRELESLQTNNHRANIIPIEQALQSSLEQNY